MQHARAGKSDQRFQYAYSRRPLYCNLDERLLDAVGWSFFDDLDGVLDAPEALHIGATTKPYYCAFVPREVPEGWNEIAEAILADPDTPTEGVLQ